MKRTASYVVVCLLLAPACSGRKSAGDSCVGNEDCRAGQVCSGGACFTYCGDDSSLCPDLVCCSPEGLCNATCDNPPAIFSVNGTGSTDSLDNRVANHLQDALTVLGNNLENTVATLVGTNPVTGVYTLAPCGDMTATEMNLRVPAALATELAGYPEAELTLAVANAVGQCATAQVSVMKGEAGVDGTFTGTGADLVSELNTTTTTTPSTRLNHYVWKAGDTMTGDLSVGGNVRVGTLTDLNQQVAGYGQTLYFSGGPDWVNDSENSDPLWIARHNTADDGSELRINIGDNPGQAADKLAIGATSAGGWNPVFEVRMDGTISGADLVCYTTDWGSFTGCTTYPNPSPPACSAGYTYTGIGNFQQSDSGCGVSANTNARVTGRCCLVK